MSFIPLNIHSQYSILDSTLSIKDIVAKAALENMSSVALTDFCNMFGAIEFYKECKAANISPIIGCEIMLAPGSRTEKKKVFGKPAGYPVTLLAKNRTGYQQLCRLTSKAYLEGFYYYPRIDKELLQECAEGLICLSGPYYGKIGSLITENNEEELETEISWFHQVFGEDYYFEVSRHKMTNEDIKKNNIDQETWLLQKIQDATEKQEKIIVKLFEIGQEKGIQCVATNDTHYLAKEDWKAHEILMNVSSGEPCEIWEKDSYGNPKNKILNPKRKTAHSHELYFKSSEEMEKLFSDYPEAVKNTAQIANKINLEFDFTKKFYPVFVPPTLENQTFTAQERLEAAENYLKQLCAEGITKKYTEENLEKVKEQYPDQDPLKVVKKRLEYELETIISKGMCDYLLIVFDFINWAKSQNIPVGPGRGSGAGSIILYLIGITDIEPLRFNLFFERFINPERVSYPDIDVDICMERRSEVIEYTINKYGQDKVAQIITFGTMKAKMAIKDVGRVLSIPLAKVNAIAKLIPDDLGITIAKALELDPDLRCMYGEDEETKRILDFGQQVEGCIRNTGIHAAGLIICGDSLTDHIPICTSKDTDIVVTQYSMKPVEMVGMLKIDFLGLKTLTCIQKAVNAIENHQGKKIDWVNLELDNKETFELLNQGKTTGIFQLESSGMQDLARQLHIDKFEEIIAVGALYRPGPMEMIPSFIQRKHGKEKILYDHKGLQNILKETYGIMVYQEQVMAIASQLAGYSLGEGDVLRRAMGKKDHEVMKEQRKKFRTGALQNKIDEKTAMLIFDKVEKFASYGFNKSHAAAYGYLSYVTAYLKANFPGEWMAALMTCDLGDLSKIAKHIREAQAMQINILPPDVNESESTFVATPKGIRFALTAIKGIGEGVALAIVEERKAGGLFETLANFIERVDTSQVGKKALENLIQSGCFDFTNWTRQQLLIYLAERFDACVKQKKDRLKGVLDFFADADGKGVIEEEAPKVLNEIAKLKILAIEKELLGFYVTGHPLEEFSKLIDQFQCTSLDQIEELPSRTCIKAAFVVDALQVRVSQRTNKKFAILVISSGLERFDLPIWPELFEQVSGILDENALLVGVIQIEKNDGTIKLSCKWIEDLAAINEESIKRMEEKYSQAESLSKLDLARDKKGKKKNGNKPLPVPKKVILTVDIDAIKMSQVLELKNFLKIHLGGDELDIRFSSRDNLIGSIAIDAAFGVKATPEFEAEILRFKSIKTVQVQ